MAIDIEANREEVQRSFAAFLIEGVGPLDNPECDKEIRCAALFKGCLGKASKDSEIAFRYVLGSQGLEVPPTNPEYFAWLEIFENVAGVAGEWHER
ncbi:hypothetical protein GCM10019059_36180 [Camelimonas fluminis]|nr:hypothetical protein GCM10019059_36180 [Camelimonas fluminis]